MAGSSGSSRASHAAFKPDATAVEIGAPNPNQERYPMCVVWTPIPLITWILPFIGHMGIADSRGIIHDFAGPYYIGEDCMAFGNPAKYWRIDHLVAKARPDVECDVEVQAHADGSSTLTGPGAGRVAQAYDEGIHHERDRFRDSQMYNFFCNNCHTYCACSMEEGGVGGPGTTWNMVKLCALIFFKGRYVSVGRFMQAHLPFFILVALITAVCLATSSATKRSRH